MKRFISIVGAGSILGCLQIVGWVELAQEFVGFRCTQPNLQSAVSSLKRETQQRPVLELNPTTLFFDLTGRFFLRLG